MVLTVCEASWNLFLRRVTRLRRSCAGTFLVAPTHGAVAITCAPAFFAIILTFTSDMTISLALQIRPLIILAHLKLPCTLTDILTLFSRSRGCTELITSQVPDYEDLRG
ncbi:hypothetical protein PoB_003145600 [Plakobranchus ocellatus]|uniref:Uncharacterized protein n=1 Tax=Plakobranchus ocellatus TaxID=259542 RepID=A0AAV4AE72_9GAST|nr:hypothetical protein PoB_003145600 [Plakobranchus ocellatus]